MKRFVVMLMLEGCTPWRQRYTYEISASKAECESVGGVFTWRVCNGLECFGAPLRSRCDPKEATP